MNTPPTDKKLALPGAMIEGNSIRSTERMTGVHRDTIMRLVARTILQVQLGTTRNTSPPDAKCRARLIRDPRLLQFFQQQFVLPAVLRHRQGAFKLCAS